MTTGYYCNQKEKLERSLDKYLTGFKEPLNQKYGEISTQIILEKSKAYYPAIIDKMPFFNTPMYDSLIILNSKMMALKKGMKDAGIDVEEYVGFMLERLRDNSNKIPKFLRSLSGKLFLSRLFSFYLKKVAVSATKNGWPTELIKGGTKDDFAMRICTRDCQMVSFMCAVGEEDIIPYCSFADFANAESMGFSLKQTSTIDSGVCTFCFNKKGKVYWSGELRKIQN